MLRFLCCLFISIASSSLFAATVQFQGKTYDVGVITPTTNTPAFANNDLIFLQDRGGNKFLVIPGDTTIRGDFDINNQRFYILQNADVVSFNRINGTVIDLSGNFIRLITQDTTTPIETFLAPLSITEQAQDICVVSPSFLGYRTDTATTTTDEKIYTITRQSNSAIVPPTILLPLKNATFPFVTFDANNSTYLTVQTTLQTGVNTDLRHRISAFNVADGTLNSEIILDNLDSTLGFSGNTGGVTSDPSTGTIYLLDSGTSTPTVLPRKIFAFTPRTPRVVSIQPSSGSFKGGTSVTITGVNFPPDAQVFFDGIPASSLTVNSTTSITAITPAHAIGAVDVVITGTGIATQLTLTAGYTYVNVAPSAAITASPTQGQPPLTVLFNIGASTDIDGTLNTRVIDFGDGNTFTFSNDLTVVSTTHIYLASGTYKVTLTVTDDLGAVGTASTVIVVGTGGDDIFLNDLVLRQLGFNIRGVGKDTVTIRGEAVLPTDISLANATVTVGYGGVMNVLSLDDNGKHFQGFIRFQIKPLNKRGFDPNTYTFTLTQSTADLASTFAMNGIDLTKSSLQTMVVFLEIETDVGRVIKHSKPAAVIRVRANAKSAGKKSNISLIRQ